MKRTQHMVMQACEEIMHNHGRADGIDRALLENLVDVCEAEIQDRDFRKAIDIPTYLQRIPF